MLRPVHLWKSISSYTLSHSPRTAGPGGGCGLEQVGSAVHHQRLLPYAGPLVLGSAPRRVVVVDYQ